MDRWLELKGAALEYSATLGGQIAVVHASAVKTPVEEGQYEDIVRISIDFVQELKSIADRLGVKLALENLIRPIFLFGWSLAELAQNFPDEGLGFCLDTGHTVLSGVNIADELLAAGRRLLSVHASNNDGLRDCHQLPSQGVLDWREVEESLITAGYGGCRVLEVWGGDEPDAVLEQLQDLWRYI
jgi:sugar phosphate isomerase/epimerase